jgi:hypothetical protein
MQVTVAVTPMPTAMAHPTAEVVMMVMSVTVVMMAMPVAVLDLLHATNLLSRDALRAYWCGLSGNGQHAERERATKDRKKLLARHVFSFVDISATSQCLRITHERGVNAA